MIDCNVINDLIIVYVSGEASEETEQLVESHLVSCPECAKAIERARLADDVLEMWETPTEPPKDGRGFIGRLQRMLFVSSTLTLLAFAVGWAGWHRFVLLEILKVERIYAQLPLIFVWRTTAPQIWFTVGLLILIGCWQLIENRYQSILPDVAGKLRGVLYVLLVLPASALASTGEMPAVLLGSVLLVTLLVFAVRWRTRQPVSSKKWVEWGYATITAVPLLGLVLVTLNTIVSGAFPGVFIAPSLLVASYWYVYRRLDRLPHMATVTVIFLLCAHVMLALRAIQVFTMLLLAVR